jgi:methyltransferase
MRLIATALLVFVPMAIEAVRAAANERRQLARGGVEPAGDVYETMRVVYPGAFVAMIAEGVARGRDAPTAVFAAGLVVFGVAKALKWMAILTLGRAWTFRVIVVPGDRRIASGPYKCLKHPNYVGVIGELVGAALMAGAPLAGTAVTAVFGALIVRRIRIEERAWSAQLQ